MLAQPNTTLGATLLEDGSCSFLVWAPFAHKVELQIHGTRSALVPMEKLDRGYFHCSSNNVPSGTTYMYRLDGKSERPDPASRFQPYGVHRESQFQCSKFSWSDSRWRGLALTAAIFYEIHVGTFTQEGTFDAIIPRLSELRSLGITMLELMPVAQFPGERNWGYDGVYPYAVQNSYGGPDGLKRLVDACHHVGLGLTLDVVYNHLGPEGNYLAEFGPYFTDRYCTPWGNAINFDGPDSDEVRRFFIENALYWVSEFHVDALRLDAIHAIIDASAKPFLEELTSRVREFAARTGRTIHLIAENDRNDSRTVESRDEGGCGFDAQWNDDFHHALHCLVTGERSGYYEDFGSIRDLAKAYSEGFAYSGQYSHFRRRRHGNSSAKIPPHRFVAFSQNHDQIGNRAGGERLSQIVSFESLKLIAGAVLLSPFVPLLFMGEEYAESAPFPYFVSHDDENLIHNVREGRRKEFERFNWQDSVPDPQSLETFMRGKLHWDQRTQGQHATLLSFYTNLLTLRRTLPALSHLEKHGLQVTAVDPAVLIIERSHGADRVLVFFNFGRSAAQLDDPTVPGIWVKQLDSADSLWGGPGVQTPEVLNFRNPVTLPLPPTSFSLFRFDDGGRH
ncbi:MAG TPA: malto-oligosyltrehalose trehalohydrolase [Candidatus Acidoferrales bacterium]|nr:malto-oligosyltrehalose trehalohydrolase [Candidatus Acidoferrales bacterium]